MQKVKAFSLGSVPTINIVRLSRRLLSGFIHDSYACRKGKGIHRGVARLEKFIRQVTVNGRQRAFYLQLDIKNYFMSIDKEILFGLIRRKCPDPDVLWLSELLIFHDCTLNPVMRGDLRLAQRLPSHKTLFHAPHGRGLPIGNLNSQFFANVYLNSLDQFVKHSLKCRHYVRYCDDFILLSSSIKQLENWENSIKGFLEYELALELNKTARKLQPITNGINFLGYIIRGNYRLVRRRVIGNLRQKLSFYERELIYKGRMGCIYNFDRDKLDELFAVISSYLGHFKHANSYKLVKAVWLRYSFLSRYFELDAEKMKIKRKYLVPGGLHRVRQQYGYFQKTFEGDIIFFQVGCYFEFYQDNSKQVGAVLNLSPLKENQRDARYGFPIRHMSFYLKKALNHNKNIVVILEREYLTKIKKRELWRRYEPC